MARIKCVILALAVFGARARRIGGGDVGRVASRISEHDHSDATEATRQMSSSRRDGLGDLLSLYGTLNNMVGIVGGVSDMRVVSRNKLTGNVIADVESLQKIHDVFKKRLKPDEKGNIKFAMNRTAGQCEEEMNRAWQHIDATLHGLKRSAMQLLEKQKSEKMSEEDLLSTFEEGVGCEGPNENEPPMNVDAQALDSAASSLDVHRKQLKRRFTNVGAWCRQLTKAPSRSHCMRLCLAIPDCKGFTWLDGDNDDEIDGARCCFRTDVSERYSQDDTACFVASRARLLQGDTTYVKNWLEERDLMKYVEESKIAEVNGLMLSTLSKQMLKDYLKDESDDRAAELKCAIDAEMVGMPPRRCSDNSLIEQYKNAVSVADPYVFFFLKSRGGNWYSINWAASLVTRLGSYLPGKLKVYADKPLKYLGWAMTYRYIGGSVNTLVESSSKAFSDVQEISPLAVAGAASFLLKVGVDSLVWGDCQTVQGFLMKDDLWDQVGEYGRVGVGSKASKDEN